MITIKDKVEQFKRDCGSYNHFVKMMIDCDERLIEIANKLRGVSSVTPKGVIYENCGNPYKENKNLYLTQEEEIIAERKSYEIRNNHVDKVLLKIDPVDREIIKDRLISKRYYKKIVDKYSYNDISAIDKHIDSVLTKVFKALES
jgi:hypothetical protein